MTKRCRPVFAYLNTWIKPGDAGDELPLLHRLAIVYLMLPMVVWLVGWFEWWFGIPVAVLLMLAFRQALSGSWRLRLRPATVALLLVALGWVMMTAAGGLLDFDNYDWRAHRSMILDLGRYPWPTYFPSFLGSHLLDQTEPLLRFYLGYYMVPGLVAHLFGPAALNWAVPLWTWIGVALILLLFTRRHRGWGIVIASAILMFFSGMDFLRMILLQGYPAIYIGRDQIEWNSWGVVMQYSSNMSALAWTPQHFIPASLYALLLLNLCRYPRFLAVSGILLATAPFWSAFVATLACGSVFSKRHPALPALAKPDPILAVGRTIGTVSDQRIDAFSARLVNGRARMVYDTEMGRAVLTDRVSADRWFALSAVSRSAPRAVLCREYRYPAFLALVSL